MRWVFAVTGVCAGSAVGCGPSLIQAPELFRVDLRDAPIPVMLNEGTGREPAGRRIQTNTIKSTREKYNTSTISGPGFYATIHTTDTTEQQSVSPPAAQFRASLLERDGYVRVTAIKFLGKLEGFFGGQNLDGVLRVDGAAFKGAPQ